MKQWILPLSSFSLALLGLVTLSSVSPELMRRQAVFLFLGLIIFWFSSKLPLKFWWEWGSLLWKGLIIVLLGLLIFGRVTRGAAAWIDLGWGLRFQPSQFALLITLFTTLPHFAARKMLSDSQLGKLLFLTGLPALLIALQPDFGTAFLYVVSLGVLLLWQKIPRNYWRIFLLSVAVLSVIGWTFVLKPYQQLRITSFFAGSQADQSSAGYNARQALIAVGSGQWLGRGLGHGTQSQLRFLPERQTDFIFASLAEEWGLVGSLTVIGLYSLILFILFREAALIVSAKRSLLLLSAAAAIASQAFVNIGMNIGLLPITGVTLPLVSYGGSSLLATFMLLGVCQQIVLENRSRRHLRIS